MNKKLFRAVIIYAILLTVLGIFFAAKRIRFQGERRSQQQSDYVRFYDSLNAARTVFYSNFPINSGDTVLVGTSLSEGYPLGEAFPGHRFRNRGIGGNETRHILGRIGDIARSKPAVIILECGINDLRGDEPDDTIVGHVRRIVDTIRTFSGAVVYLQQVLPATDSLLCRRINKLNAKYRLFCADTHIVLIPMHDRFLSGSALNPLWTVDGIHLNGVGYAQWTTVWDSVFALTSHIVSPSPDPAVRL